MLTFKHNVDCAFTVRAPKLWNERDQAGKKQCPPLNLFYRCSFELFIICSLITFWLFRWNGFSQRGKKETVLLWQQLGKDYAIKSLPKPIKYKLSYQQVFRYTIGSSVE